MKSNAYCNEFESNKVNFRMCLEKNNKRKVKKNNTKKKI